MKRLIENKLMFGSLLPIEEPHLLERYNAALQSFGLPKTKLERIQVDMTGFSPEVAKELDDWEYMDPLGINRRFIILTPQQADLPVVHTSFSNTEELMYQFYKENARALNALTIKDVIFGEIEDSVFDVESIDDLLAIEQVEFKVSTAAGVLGKTAQLKVLMDRLVKEPNAWQDNTMINNMVELAKITGDIRTNALLPQSLVFRHTTFWAAHFGGIYVFNDGDQTTVISDTSAKGFKKSRPWQVAYLDFENQRRILDFLISTGRVELPRGAWIERSGLLEMRYELMVAWLAMREDADTDFKKFGGRWVKRWVRDNHREVEESKTLRLLNWVFSKVEDWSSIDMDDIEPDRAFLLCRANPEHPDRYLVNRLISEFLPFDFFTLFVFNKPLFYRLYEEWPDNFREFVVDHLRDNYLKNRRRARNKLYR